MPFVLGLLVSMAPIPSVNLCVNYCAYVVKKEI